MALVSKSRASHVRDVEADLSRRDELEEAKSRLDAVESRLRPLWRPVELSPSVRRAN